MVKLVVLCWLFLLSVLSVLSSNLNRIVGGTSAYDGQFPYQVSLRRQGSHSCGGSIISRRYVLTAARCVGYWNAEVFSCYPASDYTIRAGSIDRFRGGVLVNVDEIIVHESYGNYLNDIALLKLSESLIYSKNIQPIPLAVQETPRYSPVIIVGWGLTKDVGDISQILQWNTLTSLSYYECNVVNVDSESILCLGHEVGNGACDYDSGSAAIWNNELVGVANFIYYACGSPFPDVYANVHYHADWIRKHSDL